MAITINATTLRFIQLLDPDFLTASADVTSLASGGFAVLGNHTTHIDGNIFDSAGIETDGWTSNTGTNGAIDQLSNGNLVIASQDADSILFQIVDGITGNTVLASTDIGDTNSSNADVAALAGGGFVIVSQDAFTSPDNDIQFSIYNNAGGLVIGLTIDASLADDRNASVAALTNGNFVVSWTRTIGADTEIRYAIYNAAGGVVFAQAVADTAGSINRNVSVTALASGGFVMVYEDNGWGTGTADITMARFGAAGNFLGFSNISNPAFLNDNSNDATPSVSQLDNGLLAVTYSNNVFSDTDTILALVDPVTGARISTINVTAGESVVDDVENVVVAGFGIGQLAVFQTNVTDVDVDGAQYEIENNFSSDGAGDVMNGTIYRDVMSGNGGSDTLFGFGGNDRLVGGDGADILNGGTGNDDMIGGLGNDQYTVDSLLDLVTETSAVGSGIDTIFSSITLTIAADVERLELTGSASIHATGLDAKADTLIGNSGANVLDGKGGNDTMRGKLGSDLYIVDSTGDVVDEVTGGGGSSDIIKSSASYTNALGVETLQLTGSAAINATGRDAQADTLIGNSGNNVLNGMSGGDLLRGGLGNDTLTGGLGGDLFRFDTALNAASNMDTITDFNAAADTIQLENAIFTLLATTGALAANLFKNLNLSAQDGDDRILYNDTTGAIFYDADGLGGAAAVQFALLTANPTITAADFVVI